MSKSKEEKASARLEHLLSTGKLGFSEGNVQKLGPLQIILRLLISFFWVLLYTIKHHLAKVVPALAGPKFLVRDKVVLLTGAGGGFGRRLAARLAARGATVACVDVAAAANQRSVDGAISAAAAAGWQSSKPVAYAFRANLADRKETQQVVKDVEEKLGRIDLLISAAVCFANYDILGFDDDEIDFLVDLNLKSTIWLVRAVLPAMKERNSGHIAVFGSVASFAPVPNGSLYAAVKAGLKGLMNSLYFEFQEENLDIGVTMLYPYFTPTSPLVRELTRSSLPDLDPDVTVEQIIDAIEARELNVVLPRWLSVMAGPIGMLPKEAIGAITRIANFRLHLPPIMPKATVTVDKWNDLYGVLRGPNGEYLKVHDEDEITPEMIQKTEAVVQTMVEKKNQGESLCEALDELSRSYMEKYRSESNNNAGVENSK